MRPKPTMPPVSGSDDARSADTERSKQDRNEALKVAERAMNREATESKDTKTASLRLAVTFASWKLERFPPKSGQLLHGPEKMTYGSEQWLKIQAEGLY